VNFARQVPGRKATTGVTETSKTVGLAPGIDSSNVEGTPHDQRLFTGCARSISVAPSPNT